MAKDLRLETLKQAIQQMDPQQVQAIREAYHQAQEALDNLEKTLRKVGNHESPFYGALYPERALAQKLEQALCWESKLSMVL